VQKYANKEFEAEKRRWSWEKGYEREQGIRMSQDYGRCRNGKGRLKQSLFLHSHHPLFHFIFPVCYQLHSRLLLFNFIIVIYIYT
jgi:hypothetical protein